MKKLLIMMIVTLVVEFSVNLCSANTKFDNNPDYKQIWARMGSYVYLYLKSINVQEYNPPYYQIGYETVTFNEDTGKEYWNYNEAKRYNWNKKISFHLESGNWVVDNVSSPPDPAKRNRYVADVIFRAAYNMDFYGY